VFESVVGFVDSVVGDIKEMFEGSNLFNINSVSFES
jgi:hypothetical protein